MARRAQIHPPRSATRKLRADGSQIEIRQGPRWRITCRRVCDCELGFGAARASNRVGAWAGAAAALEGFLADPWLLRPAGAGDGPEPGTVQVEVPLFELPEEGEDEACRAAMQCQAAEDFARRLEGAYGSPMSRISDALASA